RGIEPYDVGIKPITSASLTVQARPVKRIPPESEDSRSGCNGWFACPLCSGHKKCIKRPGAASNRVDGDRRNQEKLPRRPGLPLCHLDGFRRGAASALRNPDGWHNPSPGWSTLTPSHFGGCSRAEPGAARPLPDLLPHRRGSLPGSPSQLSWNSYLACRTDL